MGSAHYNRSEYGGQCPPCGFVLYEAYRDEAALEAHRPTAHYARWRDAVADWMAEPRKGVKYVPLFPEDENLWAARA